jgi:hypothetical protein
MASPVRRSVLALALIGIMAAGCGSNERPAGSVGASPGSAGASPESAGAVAGASAVPAAAIASPTPDPAAVALLSPAAASPGALAPRHVVAVTSAIRLPVPVSRAVALADGVTLLVTGGLTDGGTTGRILRLNLAAATATSAGRLAVAVHDAAGARLGASWIVLGGGSTSQDATVQRVSVGGRSIAIGHLPAPRADLAAVTVGDEVVILGGGAGGHADRHVLATRDGVHFRVIGMLAVGVRYAAVATFAGLIYVFGGVSDSGDVSAIQVVDPATGSARIIGHLPATLSEASAFVIGGDVLVAGGRHAGKALSAILRFDPQTAAATAWGRLPGPRADAAAAVIGGTGYLIGGEAAGPLATVVAITIR